jgi:hypothetical protein
MAVLTKKSQEIQDVLFGTTFVERVCLAAKVQVDLSNARVYWNSGTAEDLAHLEE